MSEARLLLLSGPICAGKSSLAAGLASALGARVVRAREVIRQLVNAMDQRRELQDLGAELEASTHGRWLIAPVLSVLSEGAKADLVVVDSVRTSAQTAAVKESVPGARVVYLTASADERRRRFDLGRIGDSHEPSTFDCAIDHPTESAVEQVRLIADLVIDTDRRTPAAVCADVVRWLADLPPTLPGRQGSDDG